jgi:hypothetical protein
MDIPGSPFQFTVGPLQDSGAHRVHAGKKLRHLTLINTAYDIKRSFFKAGIFLDGLVIYLFYIKNASQVSTFLSKLF